MDQVKLTLEEVHDLARPALMANGCNDANASAVARNMRAAERDGCKSHGLFRVPGYVKSLKAGKINGAAEPRLHQTAPCVIQVDGDRGVAPLALEMGRGPLIKAWTMAGRTSSGTKGPRPMCPSPEKTGVKAPCTPASPNTGVTRVL